MRAHSVAGTPLYISPEILDGKHYSNKVEFSCSSVWLAIVPTTQTLGGHLEFGHYSN
jgi:hypothetical protein